MALPFPIASTQTDAGSPIDQDLMDAFRLNQEYLDSQVGAGGSGGGPITFKVNSALWQIKPLLSLGYGKGQDGAIIPVSSTYSRARLYLKKGGTSGTLEVDVNRSIAVNHPISEIVAQYQGATQSVGRLGTALNTQSITIATPVINTLEITKPKASLDIRSILPIVTPNGNRLLYTFTGTTLLDDDYQQGDYITFAGCTSGLNDGEYEIEQVNYDGLPSVVVNNSFGVAQTTQVGTGSLSLYQYTYAASVSSQFVAGEEVLLAGHSTAGNNGIRNIYKINQGGNNIWLKHSMGATQGSAAGTATCTRWVYSYASAVDDTHYVVGEKALFASHSNANNNGSFVIREVNSIANDITVTNIVGVSQGGAAGNVNTLRWLYNMPTDPSADVSVGDNVIMTGHSSSNNDGTFEVKAVNRFAVDNIEVYNEAGVAQGGVAGTITTALKLVKFVSDFGSSYVANKSKVTLEGLSSSTDDVALDFEVKEVNRGGLTNYNVVIEAPLLSLQAGAAGRVSRESRSIFTTRPKITIGQSNQVRNFVFDDNAAFEVGAIPADSIVTMDVVSIPEGLPEELTLNLS